MELGESIERVGPLGGSSVALECKKSPNLDEPDDGSRLLQDLASDLLRVVPFYIHLPMEASTFVPYQRYKPNTGFQSNLWPFPRPFQIVYPPLPTRPLCTLVRLILGLVQTFQFSIYRVGNGHHEKVVNTCLTDESSKLEVTSD